MISPTAKNGIFVRRNPIDSRNLYDICGHPCQRGIKSLAIEQVPRRYDRPVKNPFVIRAIGSMRRDRFNHVIMLYERHLRRILRTYFKYYHACRTHLPLNKSSPRSGTVRPPESGKFVAFLFGDESNHRSGQLAAKTLFSRITKGVTRFNFQNEQS